VQTAKAAEEVAGQLSQCKNPRPWQSLPLRIAERMQEINEDTSSVTESVRQQDVATGEIAHNVWIAAEGTTGDRIHAQRCFGRGERGITEGRDCNYHRHSLRDVRSILERTTARDPAPAGMQFASSKEERALNRCPTGLKEIGQSLDSSS